MNTINGFMEGVSLAQSIFSPLERALARRLAMAETQRTGMGNMLQFIYGAKARERERGEDIAWREKQAAKEEERYQEAAKRYYEGLKRADISAIQNALNQYEGLRQKAKMIAQQTGMQYQMAPNEIAAVVKKVDEYLPPLITGGTINPKAIDKMLEFGIPVRGVEEWLSAVVPPPPPPRVKETPEKEPLPPPPVPAEDYGATKGQRGMTLAEWTLQHPYLSLGGLLPPPKPRSAEEIELEDIQYRLGPGLEFGGPFEEIKLKSGATLTPILPKGQNEWQGRTYLYTTPSGTRRLVRWKSRGLTGIGPNWEFAPFED